MANFKKTVAFFSFMIIFGVCLGSVSIKAQKDFKRNINPGADNFYLLEKAYQDYYSQIPPEERKGWKQFRRWEYFWEQRVYPTGKFPSALNIADQWKEYKKTNEKYTNKTLAKQWEPLGPVNRPNATAAREQGMGRVNAVRFHPTNPKEIWVGAAMGGVWYTKDGGTTWEKFPFTQFLSLGVSDIAFSQSNPNVAYVATGDVDGNGSSKSCYSVGIIKTTNGGQDWTITNFAKQLSDRELVTRILVDPSNPNTVIATYYGGIVKTTDGGETWTETKVDSKQFIDLKADPSNFDNMYATTFSYSGTNYIYKSTDRGNTWTKKEGFDGTIRLAMAVTPNNPNYIYILAANEQSGFAAIYFSTDKGESWDVSYDENTGKNLLGWSELGNDTKGQGFYDLAIAVSPTDYKTIYVGGINIWKSTNSGYAWTLAAHWYSENFPYVHADIHDLSYTADGSKLYVGSDGGVDVTADNGKSWQFLGDGLAITQFYKVGVAKTDPSVWIAGAQDNGTSMIQDGAWSHVSAGDGMDCAINPTDIKKVYCSLYDGELRYSTNGGKNFYSMINSSVTGETGAWVTPFVISESKPNVMYAGYENVWKSELYGKAGSWTKISTFGSNNNTMRCIAVAPSSHLHVYAANLSTLQATTDGGTTWRNMGSPIGGAITSIAVDPNNPLRIWITSSGFAQASKVYMYDGSTWTNLSGNLPNVPVNSIVYQKDSPDRLYVGTDIGVFYSDYNSNYWMPYGTDMPNVIVMELEIHDASKTLYAATYGRGLWKAPLLECNTPQPEIKVIGSTSFCAGDSIVLESKDEYDSYLWSTGETTKSITVKASGQYSLVINPTQECNSKSEIVNITVFNVKDLTITTSKPLAACIGDTINITAGMGYSSYLWSTGETTRKITVTKPGTYTCSVTTSDGCVRKSEDLVVSFHEKPAVPVITRGEGNLLTATEAAKYKWYLDGKLIDTAQSQNFIPSKTGIVAVEVANSGDCYTRSADFNFLFNGINENLNDIVTISPNPSKGLFNLNIRLQQNTEAVLSVSTINGVEIFRSVELMPSDVLNRQIDLSNRPAGVYFLTVRAGDAILNYKLIKQ